jgi:hypothetical protein
VAQENLDKQDEDNAADPDQHGELPRVLLAPFPHFSSVAQPEPRAFRRSALRFAASLMIQAGYPPKMLQEFMGHASVTTTLDLYAHLYPEEMDRYADRLDEPAREGDAAKMRPDENTGETDPEESGW